MTLLAAPRTDRRRAVRSWRRRPEPWLLVAGAAAWVVLAVATLPTGAHVGHQAGHGLPWTHWTALWALMVVAMMWPLWRRTAARAWSATFRRWRPVVLALFLLTGTGLWMLVGAIAHAVHGLMPDGVPASTWSAVWFVVAMLATTSSRRRRLLRRCEPAVVVAPRGRRAVTTAVRLGWRSWVRCVALCGPVMVAMAGPHHLLLMLAGAAAVWREQRHPRRWYDPVPGVLLAGTAVAAVVLGLEGRLSG